MNSLVVLKFGGSSMGDFVSIGKNLPHLAKIITKYQQEYQKVIVVCSALAGETRRLKSIAEGLGLENADRDAILAKGEIASSDYLGRYLQNNNIENVVMNTDTLPIYTNSKFGSADIEKVDTKSIQKNLKQNKVVIIPGFIGKNSQGQTTTLGFDGSDTTAITVASWMGADKVCLFKDVEGIYSANPKKAKAQKYTKISHDDMLVFAQCGALVVHPKAIETAREYNFDIHVLPTFGQGKGTVITKDCEGKDIIGVSYYEDDNGKLSVSVIGNRLNGVVEKVIKKFNSQKVDFKLVKSRQGAPHVDFVVADKENLDKAVKYAHQACGLDKPDFMFVSRLVDPKQISFDTALKLDVERM